MDLPELSLGWQVADWIETLLCHGPGDVEGLAIELDQDYLAAVVKAYAVNPDTGRRLIRRYVLSRAKGRAKSEFAGFLACAEALGPVRFDHWAGKGETSWWGYGFEPGEPVGRPVVRPFIRCLATEELQTGNTYDNVRFILTSDKALITGEVAGIDAGLTRTFLPQGGEIRPSSAASASKDGGKETFAVLDESHLYVLPDLKSMASTVRRNLAKRSECWSLETTTMFELGAGSTAEETFKAWETGQLRRVDVVFDHHEGLDPDTFDWEDDGQLLEALRVAYHPALWVDLDARLAEIRDPTTSRSDSVRYFLNRSHSAESDVTPLAVWDRLRVDDVLEVGATVTVGFDGSERRDSTGLVIVRAHDGLTVPVGLWEKQGKEWEVPRSEVIDRVAEVFANYRVVRMYCDPRFWESDIDQWRERYGDKVVVEIPNSDARRAKASDRWEALIATSLQRLDNDEPPGSFLSLCHNGHPDLRRHLGNATRLRLGGRAGQQGAWRPGKKTQDRKIDLVDAALLAHEARGDALADGELTLTEAEPLAVWI